MKIFSFWHDGLEKAPDVVKRCLDRWEQLNPEHELVVLSNSELEDIVDDLGFPISDLPIQARADILRIRLLRLHGGAWTDATVLPALPLDDWSRSYMNPAGFFVYSASPKFWRFTNYFILAEKDNHFISKIDDMIREYWFKPRRLMDGLPGNLQPQFPLGVRMKLNILLRKRDGSEYAKFYTDWYNDLTFPVTSRGAKSQFYPYFWQQYIMMYIVKNDLESRDIISRMPYRMHEFTHTVQNGRQTLSDDFERAIPQALRTAPIQKLDWRITWPDSVFQRVDPSGIIL